MIISINCFLGKTFDDAFADDNKINHVNVNFNKLKISDLKFLIYKEINYKTKLWKVDIA
jgi:hypothetical protein